MKILNTFTLLLLFAFAVFVSCSKQVVEPNFTGSIKGQVLNSATGTGIPLVSISTNPGTNVLLTDSTGHFMLNDVPTGNYTIQAKKDGFETTVVRVNVERNETASAKILLKKGGDKSASAFIEARVTNFFNHSSNDSSFVDVSYRVENTSGNKLVPKFQVYFKIYASKTTFYAQIGGDTLDAGQQDVGSFTQYLHKLSADSVVVSGIYASEGS